jgi:ornithine cyclodeaminase
VTAVYSLGEIRAALTQLDPVAIMESAFVAYSAGRVAVPPVGEMIFSDPPGEIHIKYGYEIGAEHAIVKVVSGFYENVRSALPTRSGVVLVISQKTGVVEAILLDEGDLTDVRTAAAGAVAARYLAPKNITTIGVLGSGIQAKLQVTALATQVPCRNLIVWSRNAAHAQGYAAQMAALGYNVQIASEPRQVAECAELIITATASCTPLLQGDWIRSGTHITAMGSDTPDKQELDADVLGRADIVVVDSLDHSRTRGEVARAVASGTLLMSRVSELGQVIRQPQLQRQNDSQVSVADLTGIAAQDIALASAILAGLPRQTAAL